MNLQTFIHSCGSVTAALIKARNRRLMASLHTHNSCDMLVIEPGSRGAALLTDGKCFRCAACTNALVDVLELLEARDGKTSQPHKGLVMDKYGFQALPFDVRKISK